LILWEPEAEAGTVKVPLQLPEELAEIAEVTAVPSKVTVMSVSLAPKPEPVTVTELLGGPLVRLRVIAGLTRKVMPVTEPAEVTEPDAPIVWEPAIAAGMVIVVFQFPRELAEMPEVTVVPSKVTVMPVSLAPKPEPVMVTELPGEPLVRFIVSPGLTVKVTPVIESAEVDEPYAPTVWEPATEAGTVKVPLQAPTPLAVIPEVTTVPSKVTAMPVSLAPKPVPLTVMEVPGGPLVLLRVRVPPSTVKLTPITLPVVEPDAPIIWEPAVAAGIVIVVLQFPRESAGIPDLTVLPSKVTATVSLARKPEPVTVTEVPGGPLVLLREMVLLVTVKVTPVTGPEEEPIATMVWEPAVAVGIVIVVLQIPEPPTEIPEATVVPSKVILALSPEVKL
jgi:hypothetical protein